MAELPRGVQAESGLLFASITINPGAGVAGSQVVRPAVGPGFAVGIHGYQAGYTGGAGADATRVRWHLSLDESDVIAQTGLSAGLYYSDRLWNTTTSGTVQEWSPEYYYHDLPVLTLKPFVVAFTPGVAAATLQMSVLYAIYKVSDSDFLRIAGLSLARG